jgi:hypothetical protein
MDANYGAVEPQYMQKSAVGGDPYSCLFQRILVLPNKPAPPGVVLMVSEVEEDQRKENHLKQRRRKMTTQQLQLQ